MKIFTAPQHTRSILPPFHPTKSSLRCVGGIFLFWELLGARPLHLAILLRKRGLVEKYRTARIYSP